MAASFRCGPTANGFVRFEILDGVKIAAGMEIPGEVVGQLIGGLLDAAARSAHLAGQSRPDTQGQSLAGVVCFVPTKLSLSSGIPPEPLALVVHAGMARIGFAVTGKEPHELGEALIAASASGRAH